MLTGDGKQPRGWLLSLSTMSLTLAVAGTALAVAPHAMASFADSFAAKQLALALAAVSGAALLVRERTLRLASHELAAFGVVGIALLSFAVHAHRGAYEASPVACAAAALVVATAGRMVSLERPRLRAFTLDLVLATATIVALLAIAESMGLPLPWSDETRRPQSTLGNRNFVRAYAAIALPLALAKGMHRARSWRSAALVVIVATLGRDPVSERLARWAAGRGRRARGGCLEGSPRGWAGRQRAPRVCLALSGLGVVAGAAGPWRALRWTEPAPLFVDAPSPG